MKLQNLAVIFVIIMIPISIVLSSYIENRVETLNAQIDYDEKLYDSTYDAVTAYQKNTINSSTSDLVNSKLRDIEASANVFLKSAAENFNLQGTGKKAIESFVPAIVYTLYDGYYIYTPYTNTLDDDAKQEIIDEIQQTHDGSVDEEDILKSATYHDGDQLNGLRPYVYYSCRYVRTDLGVDVVINYSLDSYITITGKVGSDTVNLEGYLLSSPKETSGTITYRGIQIDGEEMTKEKVLVTDKNDTMVERIESLAGVPNNDKTIFETMKVNGTKYYRGTAREFVPNYTRIIEDAKNIYGGGDDYDGSGGQITIVNENNWDLFGGEVNAGRYAWDDSYNIPSIHFVLEEGRHYDFTSNASEVFRNLNSKKIEENTKKEYFENSDGTIKNNEQAKEYYRNAIELRNEILTEYQELSQIRPCDAVDETGTYIKDSTTYNEETKGRFSSTTPIFKELNNLIETEQTQIEDDNSDFNNHKLDVIKYTIEKNLTMAITNYNQISGLSTDFAMPKLKEEEWDRISKNISVITFLQGVQAGSKEYNGYAVVNNNKNEHFVSKDSIYISIIDSSGKEEYHNIKHSGLADLINAPGVTARGYFNVDYEIKNGTEGYYCPRSGATECYDCMIRSDNTESGSIEEILKKPENAQLAKIYYTALARERQAMYRIGNIYKT